jgi:hypothetical protein
MARHGRGVVDSRGRVRDHPHPPGHWSNEVGNLKPPAARSQILEVDRKGPSVDRNSTKLVDLYVLAN